jgi:hypothetical protein
MKTAVESFFKILDQLNLQNKKTLVHFEDYISYAGCRDATEAEKDVVMKIWKLPTSDLGMTSVGEGECSWVYGNDDFVVKIAKPGRDFSGYFELHKYMPHQTGYSTIESECNRLLLIRKTFLEHILFPTLMSPDYKVCVQDRISMDTDKARAYFEDIGVQLELLGPLSNVGWSGNKGQIIDVY